MARQPLCVRASPALLPAVSAFYRGHRSSPPSQHDVTFALMEDDDVRGAVRLSPKRCSQLGDLCFLRGLLIDPARRRHGLGSMLVRHALDEMAPKPAFTFAYSELGQRLYEPLGFSATEGHGRLPHWLKEDFSRVSAQQARKGRQLILMTRGLGRSTSSAKRPLRLILLQHANEARRKTATGPLLLHDDLAPHLRVERWVWSGRADSDSVARRIQELPRRPKLLWTDAHVTSTASAEGNHAEEEEEAEAPAFVLLDGTWQEARAMFRKGPPMLRELPRVALRGSSVSSTYALRGDFGWRSRFGGAADDGSALLCTAETAASLLDLRGDTVGGDRVRNVLDEFQLEYAQTHPHLLSAGLDSRGVSASGEEG